MKTKKMLVAFDKRKPDQIVHRFIFPHIQGNHCTFTEFDRPQKWEIGYVVYTGVELNENELLARYIESGQRIRNLDALLKIFRHYLDQLVEFRIGDMVEIELDSNEVGFKLIKSQYNVPKKRSKLP